MGVVAVIAVLILATIMVHELSRRSIEIQLISSPKELADQGYTSEVAARRLQDALYVITVRAATGLAGTKLSMRGDLPDFVVPQIGISLNTIATYLQDMWHSSRRTVIAGEVILRDGLTLQLRVNGRALPSDSQPVGQTDKLWQRAARAILLQISPHVLAWADYDSDPRQANRLAETVTTLAHPGSESVPWCYVLRAQFKFEHEYDFDGADELLQMALQIAPRFSAAHEYRGRFLLDQGRFGEAIDSLRRAIWLDRNSASAYHYLALAQWAEGHFGHAASAFIRARQKMQAALESDPHDFVGYRSFGNVLDAQGWSNDAAVAFERSLRIHEAPETHSDYGAALASVGRNKEALEHFHQAVQLAPQNSSVRATLCNFASIGELEKAKMLDADCKEFAEARLQSLSRPESADITTAELVSAAYYFLKAGRMRDARSLLLETIRRNDADFGAHFGLARTLEEDGDLADPKLLARIENEWHRTLELEVPPNVRTRLEFASFLRRAGNDDQAKEELARASRFLRGTRRMFAMIGSDAVDPIYYTAPVEALDAEGDVDLAAGDFTSAIEAYQDIFELTGELRIGLARALIGAGRRDEATRLYREMTARQPPDPEAANELEKLVNGRQR